MVKILDYEEQQSKEIVTGEFSKIDLPKSNVLQFILADGSKISARPSGTEPKIKFYFSVNTKLKNVAEYALLNKQLDKKINDIIIDMNLK